MSESWAFSTLNELSPLFNNSPENGSALHRDPFSLSFPIDSAALANSLEQWNSLPFESQSSTAFFDTEFDSVYPAALSLPLPVAPTATLIAPTPPTTKKRAHSTIENATASTSNLAIATDDSANTAAFEEDKRKRNTAASGAFAFIF